jgi:hypothetical protein
MLSFVVIGWSVDLDKSCHPQRATVLRGESLDCQHVLICSTRENLQLEPPKTPIGITVKSAPATFLRQGGAKPRYACFAPTG